MSKNEPTKKAGLPPASAKTRAVKPNITIPANIQEDGIGAASRIGLGFSAFVAQAIIRECGRIDAMLETNRRESGDAGPAI